MKKSINNIAGLFLFVTVLPLMIWTLWYEPQQLKIQEMTLSLPNWPPELDGTRVALISDLHAGPPYGGLDQLRRIAMSTNQAKPDIILFLGDLVQTHFHSKCFIPPEDCAMELGKLRAPFGVYGVLGNHDWWYDAPRVARALQDKGMVLLENRSTKLLIKHVPLWLAGVSDFSEQQDDLPGALRKIPKNQPIILLSHNPDLFSKVPESVSLTVSGHTHGGQVKLPILGRPLVPSRYGQRFAEGHIVENGKHLFVTVGAGNLWPIRLGVPPEIVILTLRH